MKKISLFHCIRREKKKIYFFTVTITTTITREKKSHLACSSTESNLPFVYCLN